MMTDVRLHQPAVETRCYISQCLRQQHITQSDITYIMLRDFLFMNLFDKLHDVVTFHNVYVSSTLLSLT